MKQWLKEYRVRIILSILVTLLPMLFGIVFWDRLPDVMTTHWGAGGVADGTSGKAFAVFLPTSVMLALNLVCLLATAADKKNRNQNKKAFGIIFWIMPMISLLVNGMMYSVAFEQEVRIEILVPILFGVMFVMFGNYLPKIKQNRTMGIKISWTLNNEENWYMTHRLAGKLWVAGGLALMVAAFLPASAMIWTLLLITVAMIGVPVVYSYTIYKMHKKQGIDYTPAPKNRGERAALRMTAVTVPLILIGVAALMFTGDIHCEVTDEALHINASYYDDLTVDLDDIDSISYQDNFDIGTRTYGFGSPKLSMGVFRNDTFGSYTLYAYTGCDAAIVIESEGKILVIGFRDAAATRQLYETIQSKLQ